MHGLPIRISLAAVLVTLMVVSGGGAATAAMLDAPNGAPPTATPTNTATATPTDPPTPTPVATHTIGGIVCRGPYDPNFCEYLYAFPNVMLQPLGWQTATDYHGHFQFDGVPDGQYTLALAPSCVTNAVGGLSCYAPLAVGISGADAYVTWKPTPPATPTPTATPPAVGGIADVHIGGDPGSVVADAGGGGSGPGQAMAISLAMAAALSMAAAGWYLRTRLRR